MQLQEMSEGMRVALLRCIALVSIIGLFAAIVSVDISSNSASVEKRNSYYEALVVGNKLQVGSPEFSHVHSVDNNIISDDYEIALKDFLDHLNDQEKDLLVVSQEVSKTLLAHKHLFEDEDTPSHRTLTEESFLKLPDHGHSKFTEDQWKLSPTKDSFKDYRSPEFNNQKLIDHNSGIPSSPSIISQFLPQPKAIPKPQSIKKSAVLTERSEPSTRGYVLAVNYYEQQSMGSRNLFQLQCWAQHLGLVVVKPVMRDSFLLTPLDQHQQQTLLRFEDSFNLQAWMKQTSISHFAQLVEWSEFLSKAPRNVILVQYNYPSVSVLKSRQKAGKPVLQDHIGDRYKSGCGSKWPTSSQQAFLRSNMFLVVRSVCFNFFEGDQLSLDEFNAHLLGEFHPDNVTIIMDMWRGLGTGQRVLIKDTCASTFPINENIKLSNRLLNDASRYVETYMGGRPFTAVMGRLEMTLLTVHKKEPILPFCLREIVSEINVFKKDMGINTTFISIDIGRYGSKKWRTSIDPGLERDFGSFIQNIYGPSTSVSSWERTFEDVVSTRDAGYIGLLQKAVVTRAKCILFAGGGAFQRHALHLYRELHPRKEDQCLRVVASCTSTTKFRL